MLSEIRVVSSGDWIKIPVSPNPDNEGLVTPVAYDFRVSNTGIEIKACDVQPVDAVFCGVAVDPDGASFES